MAKLLPGEDMSGSGEGVCPAISNAVTNLYARMSINSIGLAEMGVPKTYLEALPKRVTCLDSMYLSSEHIVVEMANRVEASTYIWRRRAHSRHLISLYRSTGARSSWGDDSGKDDESNGNTFDWSEKGSSSQLKRN
ncbi:hypothetical protein Bca4012_056898 [Brassica carinata]